MARGWDGDEGGSGSNSIGNKTIRGEKKYRPKK